MLSARRQFILLGAAAVMALGESVTRADVTAGVRVWLADYRVGMGGEKADLGTRPFYGAQYESPLPGIPLSIVSAAAHGEGWDLRTRRFDVMLGAMYQQQLVSLGVAWHGIGFGQTDLDYRVFENGIEALAGVAFPISPVFSARAAATLLPVMMVADNQGGSTLTYGYAWDLGLGARLDTWSMGAGYRFTYVADNAVTKAQEFHGPYAMIAYTW